MRGTIGLVANPASGKDIRRLVASASVFDNMEKLSIVRRAIIGAAAAGVQRFLYMPDSHSIASTALREAAEGTVHEPLESPGTDSALDTTRAAAELHRRRVGCVITLGGDGTNRALALGWRDAPLVPISTGTNNVFPRMIEGTIAGVAAGLVASNRVALEEVSNQAKVVYVEVDGEKDDLALIDAVFLDETFIGSRAVWEPSRIKTLVLARADPAAVGMSAIGGLTRPLRDAEDAGLRVEIGEGGSEILVPIAPGYFRSVPVQETHDLALGEATEIVGPGVIALDGERERRLKPGQIARLTVIRDGPRVVDVPLVMKLAACRGFLRTLPDEVSDGD